jgi:hypothetical protein
LQKQQLCLTIYVFVHNVEAKGTVSKFTNLKVTIVSRFWVEKLESNANLSHLNKKSKVGGLDLSRRDLNRDSRSQHRKKSVSTVEKISTVSKS